jgi:hypothetical protein
MGLIFNHGDLNELKNKLKKKYPQLNEADFQQRLGVDDGVYRMLEFKLKISKKELRDVIAAL